MNEVTVAPLKLSKKLALPADVRFMTAGGPKGEFLFATFKDNTVRTFSMQKADQLEQLAQIQLAEPEGLLWTAAKGKLLVSEFEKAKRASGVRVLSVGAGGRSLDREKDGLSADRGTRFPSWCAHKESVYAFDVFKKEILLMELQ